MGKRGGGRVGAGRPRTGINTTKATIYKSDRELINSYASALNVSVNELFHRIFHHEDFKYYFYTQYNTFASMCEKLRKYKEEFDSLSQK